jgi:radical SAM enzyme (TIGR04100 family)
MLIITSNSNEEWKYTSMMTILYEVGNNLYVNLTNRCPCNCVFCIRHNGDGAYGSDSLWLDHEPDIEEVIQEFKKRDLSKYEEVVVCGYGEPLMRLNMVVQTCRYIRSISNVPIRLNTNGLANLVYGRNVTEDLRMCFDTISISLNAGSEETYQKVTNPTFKENAYQSLLRFAVDCKKVAPKVMFTVVDVISKEEIELAQMVADSVGIPLRVRTYTE